MLTPSLVAPSCSQAPRSSRKHPSSSNLASRFIQDPSPYTRNPLSTQHCPSIIPYPDHRQAMRIDEGFWDSIMTDNHPLDAEEANDHNALDRDCNTVDPQYGDKLNDRKFVRDNLYHTVSQECASPPSPLGSAFALFLNSEYSDTDLPDRTSTGCVRISSASSVSSSSSWGWPSFTQDLDIQVRSSTFPLLLTNTCGDLTASSSCDTLGTLESFIDAARTVPYWPTPPSSNDDLKAVRRNQRESQV